MNTQLEQDLAAANPVAVDPSLACGSRAQTTLARTMTTSAKANAKATPAWRVVPPTWRLAPVAALAVVSILVTAMTVTERQTTSPFAATPAALSTEYPPETEDPAAELAQLASVAAQTPDDVGAGDIAEVRIKSWSLFTRVDGRQVVSEVVPMRTTTRTFADGTATVDQSYFYNGEKNDRFTTAGALDYPLRGLSRDPAKLAEQLKVGQPAENGTAGLFDSIVVANRQMPIEPPVRAALLRVLAKAPGVSSVGSLDDRNGRPGVGFVTDSDYSGLPTRYMLIFDPEGGRLLGYEETLTTSPGKLNVRVPAVINYQVFERSQYTQ